MEPPSPSLSLSGTKADDDGHHHFLTKVQPVALV